MRKISLLFLAFLITGIIKSQSLAVSASVIQNVSCNGGNNGVATCSPSGGTAPYTYLWLPVGRTTQTVATLTAATYTVHVTDHIGNTVSASATITQPSTLGLSASAKYVSICALQKDSLFATGSGGTTPYSYTWSGPIGDISCPTCANTAVWPDGMAYLVTAINDANGCSATASVSITVYTPPFVSIQGPLSPVTTFNNDTLIALSPGASSYLWSNSATTSAIIVSPVVTTQYTVTTTDTHGCIDTARYIVSPNSSGNGRSSGTAIAVSPSTNITTTSYSSMDSVVWFSFIPTDSNNQIIANSAYMGLPFPHTHRLTLFDNSLHMIVDEPLPDIIGANQIRIDISHLHPGSTYYVRAARCPAHANMQGCNPSASGECNPFMRWDFQMCFRTVPVFVPNDSGNEAPSISQLYYEDRGQIADLNDIPRFDIKAYTNFASPAVCASDSLLSFVYSKVHSGVLNDTAQRVDMVLTGTYVQPSQPVFKMQEDSNAGYLNYFKEYVPNGVTKVQGYARLVYKNVYPNVDMQVYSNLDGTKLYFICNPAAGGSPGGNPSEIELQFNGANSVSVTGGGGLNVATDLGTLKFAPGFAYTDSAGIIKPKSWQAYFVAVNSNTVKFNTGAYNTTEPLVIRIDRGHQAPQSYPPIKNMHWSTLYGGTNQGDLSIFLDVTHDDSGNVYTAGWTNSFKFPVINGVISSWNGDIDAVAVSFSGSDFSRRWGTYYGGSLNEEATGIGVDDSGNVFITGYTLSPDFPKVHLAGAYNQSALAGNQNAFIAKFTINKNGPRIPWSTWYGGTGNETAQHLAMDNTNNYVYIVGEGADTSHTPKKTEAGAMNNTYPGSGLIAKFTTNGVWKWGTTIKADMLNGCAVDGSGNFYIVGSRADTGYPVTSHGLAYSAYSDAVATAFDGSNALQWSTYFGGNNPDYGHAIAVDASGNAYITGNTFSSTLPTQPSGSKYYQSVNNNFPSISGLYGNSFIAEFAPISSANPGNLLWGTYFGGDNEIEGNAITIDADNNIYLTGNTQFNPPGDSGLFRPGAGNPALYYSQSPSGSFGTFVAAFNNSGYWWGSYIEDGGNCYGYGITDYNASNLYIVGRVEGSYVYVDPPNSWFQTDNDTAYDYGSISEFNLLGAPTAVNELKVESGKVKVYPNPTNENVIVQLNIPQAGNVQFILYNLLGEPVYTNITNEPAGLDNKQISLTDLPNGNYILQVTEGNRIYHAKITKLQ